MLTPPPKLSSPASRQPAGHSLVTKELRRRLRTPLTIIVAVLSITIVVLAVLTQMTVAAPKAHAATYARTPVSATLSRIAAHPPISNVHLVLAPTKGTLVVSWYSSDPHAAFLVGATGLLSSRTSLLKVTNRTALFRNLDERMPYLFTITPVHRGAVGPRSTVLLRGSIAGIRTVAAKATPTASPSPSPSSSATPASTPMTASSPPSTPTASPSPTQVAQAPAPPPPAPQPPARSTRTVYSCPTDFTEVSGVCTQYRAYTFHAERRTRPYTFHTEFAETSRTWRDFGTDSSGTTCPRGGTMHDGKCVGWDVQGSNVSVKDSPPAGWLDDGSTYVRDEQIRDDMPEGFADEGTQWVRTAARIATEVPA